MNDTTNPVDDSEPTRSNYTPATVIPILTNNDFNELSDNEAQVSSFKRRLDVKDIIGDYYFNSGEAYLGEVLRHCRCYACMEEFYSVSTFYKKCFMFKTSSWND